MNEVSFLDHGVVRLRDVMGDDLTVVNAARVSFDSKSDWVATYPDDPTDSRGYRYQPVLKNSDDRLIHFLAEGGHWSPFAHPQISLEIYVPGMVLDQLVKHRIGMMYSDDAAFVAYENAADNQMSMRYKEPQHFHVPEVWRSAPENKKQGSGGPLEAANGLDAQAAVSDWYADALNVSLSRYQTMINNGVAPEQARLVLPYYAMYTRRYWTSSLMGIIRFLQLREKPDAQYEIRELAKAVHTLILPRFPVSFAAYGLN